MKRLFTLSVIFCSVAAFAVSPYINKVYEFVPAPGQFINTLPAYTEGDTEASMLAKVNTALVGNGSAITLGAFGGYVTVGFDHSIVNVKGEKDFLVYGNAFINGAEPGVIMLMQDENGNGLPDDTWYEIAGSEYNNDNTVFNYEITYYKPSAEDDAATIAIDEYIRWTDNLGGEGFIPKNTFNRQSYYPQWISDESYTLRGTLLPKNAFYDEGSEMWKLPAFAYGYADNQPIANDNAKIDISWAVKADGTPANLSSIDFIRIHTGENQVCGLLGETSTEVTGAEDLHPEVSAVEEAEAVSFVLNPFTDEIVLVAAHPCSAAVYDLCGRCRLNATLTEGTNRIPAFDLGKGTYILRTENKSYKIIKL